MKTLGRAALMTSAASLALAAATPALAQDARDAQNDSAQDGGQDLGEPIIVLGDKL
jgi:hypothetical protein